MRTLELLFAGSGIGIQSALFLAVFPSQSTLSRK
jgi:hypothetical protein